MEYTIYTRAGFACPYCQKAAALLDEYGISYSMRPLATDELLKVAKAAGMTTVPIVYHGDTLIGGYTELWGRVSRIENI